MTFNEDAVNYDTWRPRYCDELFSDIISYSRLNENNHAVEVGCGTGQATGPILKTGCSVVAVEYGERLANYTRNKYKQYNNLRVENVKFELFLCESNSIDLVYSATAFHWIPEEIGYKKVYDMLKSGGTIALFWNKPFTSRNDDPLHKEIQNIYNQFIQEGTFIAEGKNPKENIHIENDTVRYKAISDTIIGYGFKDLKCHLYKSTRSFSAENYISLLNTYSDHRTMESQVKGKLFCKIKETINYFGGIINIHDTMDLYLARKP